MPLAWLCGRALRQIAVECIVSGVFFINSNSRKMEDVLQSLYDEANKIYHNYLWNGHNTDAELNRLAELRRLYVVQSGGRTMPDLEYKSFN